VRDGKRYTAASGSGGADTGAGTASVIGQNAGDA
jgi:hypothetical protein